VGFTPSAAPMEDHNMGSDDRQGENHRDKDDKDQSKMKKQKMSEKYHDEHNADSLVPMQLALTPFPLNVDVAKNLQAKKTKETSLELAVMERKHFQFLYKRRLVTPADSSKVGIDDRNQDDTPQQQKSLAAVQQNLSVTSKDLDRARLEELCATKLHTPSLQQSFSRSKCKQSKENLQRAEDISLNAPVKHVLMGSVCKQSNLLAQRVGDRSLNGKSVQQFDLSVLRKMRLLWVIFSVQYQF
jgi:hypothetical protein